MATKKGIIVTITILAAVTGASFVFWFLPQDNPSTFVVTNYENYLDSTKKIHKVLEEAIEIEFQNMIDGNVTADEYVEAVDATTSQVTVQITEFVKSDPPEEWQESYINYMDAMRKFNSYLIETKVVASMIDEDDGLEQSLHRVETLKSEYLELINLSDEARP